MNILDDQRLRDGFEKEIAAFPAPLQQAFQDWHGRLHKQEHCILEPEAEAAYQRYRDALVTMKAQLRGDLMLETLYDTLPSDALLVATLNASLQSTQAETVISLPDWALAQEFAEWWRERYHKIIKPEEREKIFFIQELSGRPAQSARISVQGYEIPIVPTFFYAELVVQTVEPKYHFFRLLVQRAYYR